MSTLDRSIAPPIHPFGRLVLPPERVEVCSNGSRLHIMADDGACPLTRLCIIGRGGKVEARPHAAALLAAELLPEGSELYDADTTAEMIDFNGASVSGRSNDHFTRLDLTALTSAMPELLPMFGALVSRPDFSRARYEASQSLLASQCAYDRKRVSNVAFEKCFSLMAGDDNPVADATHPDDFVKVDAEVVKRLICRTFVASNVDVFLSGGVTPSLEQSVVSMIDSLRPGPAVGLDIRPLHAAEATTLRVKCDGAEQTAVVAMLPAVPRTHPDYLPLRIAVTALGGFFGSRLMQNIREDKGLTYGISASLNGIQEGSFVEISAQCAPQYTSRLIDELRIELLRMASEPLSADELLRVRLYEQTRIASMLDNAIAGGDQYITQLVVGLPEKYFENQERITARITAEEIADVASRYLLPDEMRIVIAG